VLHHEGVAVVEPHATGAEQEPEPVEHGRSMPHPHLPAPADGLLVSYSVHRARFEHHANGTVRLGQLGSEAGGARVPVWSGGAGQSDEVPAHPADAARSAEPSRGPPPPTGRLRDYAAVAGN
jgi:hypothetical protein